MIEKVGDVTLDYTFYKGIDAYSDGDIEDDLLKYVKQKDKSIIQILSEDNRWPILYHLSPIRENILDWYPFEKNADVLEVGAGCGAVTAALCRNAKSVTCVELSKRRSLINAHRNNNFGNLNILVGNFNDIKLTKKYDYITLIGVLEYAAYYTDHKNPFEAFISNLKDHLNENGKLLIAIENKFGLKYWAGCVEDHTGQLFDGLENYKDIHNPVKTFSKNELFKIFSNCGFTSVNFYYPFPDYKFPKQIFSDDYLPKHDDLQIGIDTYDNNRIVLFDEVSVAENIVDSKEFPLFSNSFFIEITK